MNTSERLVDALEYIVHDLLALMLRANDDGFSAREVLTAMEFILCHSRLALDEQKDSPEISRLAISDSSISSPKMMH